jgi:hypothetical protein
MLAEGLVKARELGDEDLVADLEEAIARLEKTK